MEISCASTETPLGIVMIGATDKGLCSLQFGNSQEKLSANLKELYPGAELTGNTKTDKWLEEITQYLSGKAKFPDLPVDINKGTDFQRKVWQYLQTIPRGKVVSYTDVARAVGNPKAIRAAASACGKNNIAVIIPCHRVLRSNGELAGYRWGLNIKNVLLELEKVAVT